VTNAYAFEARCPIHITNNTIGSGRGRLCAMPPHTPKERLTAPLIRDSKSSDLRPATWDEALDRVVSGFGAVKARSGGSGFALFSCSKSTNEMNYAAQKFGRTVLGTNNIDSCNRT